MKHTLLFAAFTATMLFSTAADAQKIPVVSKVAKVLPKFTLGLKAGANFQQLNSKSTFDNSYKGGVLFGAFAGLTKNKMGVQVEGMIKTVKYAISNTIFYPGTKDINTVYLDVPVLFEYKFAPRLWGQIGPQFSSLLSAKNGSTDVKTSFNTTDFSGVIGFQAILPVHIIAGARYVLGLSDINNDKSFGTDAWHNRSFQIFVGYRFL